MFLYDEADTYEKALERRKKRQEATIAKMLRADTTGEETGDDEV